LPGLGNTPLLAPSGPPSAAAAGSAAMWPSAPHPLTLGRPAPGRGLAAGVCRRAFW